MQRAAAARAPREPLPGAKLLLGRILAAACGSIGPGPAVLGPRRDAGSARGDFGPGASPLPSLLRSPTSDLDQQRRARDRHLLHLASMADTTKLPRALPASSTRGRPRADERVHPRAGAALGRDDRRPGARHRAPARGRRRPGRDRRRRRGAELRVAQQLLADARARAAARRGRARSCSTGPSSTTTRSTRCPERWPRSSPRLERPGNGGRRQRTRRRRSRAPTGSSRPGTETAQRRSSRTRTMLGDADEDEPAGLGGARGRRRDEELLDEAPEDPGAGRRFWFEHATGAGKTVAAVGFVEASRTGGVLILTHRRNLVDQFIGEISRPRLQGPALAAAARRRRPPLRPGDRRDLPVVRAQRGARLRRLLDRDLRRGPHRAGREDQRLHPQLGRARSSSA